MAASLILSAAMIGGGVLLTGRRARAREVAAEAAYPPTGQFIDVGGTRVHAHVQGQGRDLVLLHGASGNTRDFTFSLVDRLAQHYRVIAFDRLGLGWTAPIGHEGVSPFRQAALLQQAARLLGVRRPIVLGHSYGGAVAMAWGLTAATETAALVIVSGATMPWPGGLGPFYAVTGSRVGAAAVIPAITAFASARQAEAVIQSIFAPAPAPDGYVGYVGAALTLRRVSLRANAAQVSGLKPHVLRMAAEYPRLQVPVELLHGRADTIVPAHIHAIPLSRLLPDARLTLLPDAAHMPHHTHPEAVIAAIHRAADSGALHRDAPSPY